MGRPLRDEYRGAMYQITGRGKVEALGVKEPEILRKRSRSNTARKFAIDSVPRYSGAGNAGVGGLFGGIRYRAIVRQARHRQN